MFMTCFRFSRVPQTYFTYSQSTTPMNETPVNLYFHVQTGFIVTTASFRCLILWLQMATTAKPEIMHVCYVSWKRAAWAVSRMDWDKMSLLKSHDLVQQQTLGCSRRLLITTAPLPQGETVKCIRACKWVHAINVQNSWNEVHCLK